MDPRQRYLQTLLFGAPDRVPLDPGVGRKSTLAAWHAQGLPADINTADDANEYAYRLAGGTLPLPRAGEPFPVNERMIPTFEEKVLERGERTQIVQDWKGNICEISNDYSVEYLRNPIDFVTRRWIRCPVETWDDWRAMQARYDPDDPARLPAAGAAERFWQRDWIVQWKMAGPFWQMREWLGFERLCTTFYDDPRLIRDMVAFWEAFIARLLQNAFRYVIPDIFYISEDMAYKQFSMISPAMTREFLFPTYRRWGRLVRDAGVPIYAVDSDGYIGQLIPIWIEAGANVCDPIEVAAGNDLAAFRRQFGRRMAYRGGIDKRAIAAGSAELEAEIQRVAPVIDDGGYIPSCDHGVPADVPWSNYVHYVELLARATGWL